MNSKKLEESLDPHDWDAMRGLGHKMVDDMLAYLSTVRDRPVWKKLPESAERGIRTDLPLDPSPFEQNAAHRKKPS